MIFETANPVDGWDGEVCTGGGLLLGVKSFWFDEEGGEFEGEFEAS